MKVRELIEALAVYDENFDVILATSASDEDARYFPIGPIEMGQAIEGSKHPGLGVLSKTPGLLLCRDQYYDEDTEEEEGSDGMVPTPNYNPNCVCIFPVEE